MPLRLRLPLLSVLLCAINPAQAQNALYVEYEGHGHLVRAAHNNLPCIQFNGKLQSVKGYRMALQPVKEYLPVFVAIRDLNVHSSRIEILNTGGTINNEMHFSADFESAYALGNVFLMLDLNTEEAGKGFFIYEIGKLNPYQPRGVRLTVPLSSPMGAGHFQIHLFADGVELLHSEIPALVREQSVDRMIARRIKDVQEAAPRPFIGPLPQYPAKFKKSKAPGHALIAIRITATGAILDPQLVSATAPEFGEAALAAARLWRFLPAVRQGHPVEVKAQMPFDFKDPVPEGKGG